MLAKAGESDRAIRVKMVRPVFFFSFSLSGFGHFSPSLSGSPVVFLAGLELDVGSFPFSPFVVGAPSTTVHLFFSLSAQTSLLWETEGG
jgi:hypothetical protein